MELTEQEQEAKQYAARCFDNRYALLQQISCDLLARLAGTERAYMELSPSEMPIKAVEMAVTLMGEIDRYTDEHGEELREYYRRRHKQISAAWDPSKFSSEAWLKNQLPGEENL